LVAALTGGSVRMATGGLARVDARELAPREGVLRWLLPPPVLSD